MTEYEYSTSHDVSLEPAAQARKNDRYGYLKRSRLLPLLYLIPALFCGLSWAGGGMPVTTDIGFALFSAVSFVLLFNEFYRFPQRFGIGGMALFGGALVWFSHDYFSNWFGRDFFAGVTSYSSETIAKAAFYHCLFMACATAGLLLARGEWVLSRIEKIPEPNVQGFYFILVIICFLIGMIPYFFFTAEGGVEAIYGMITGGRTRNVTWLVGRSGSVNTNWGAYLAQLLQVGQLGAQLGAFCALLVLRNLVTKGICWAIWLLYAAISFGSGTRGDLAFMVLPVLALLFIKYQARAVDRRRRHSLWAYALAAAVGFILLFFVQLQAAFRDRGFTNMDVSNASALEIRGNTMFSEGLFAWAIVPEYRNFYYSQFPGQALVAPLPVTLWNFLTGPIPRALWPGKPLDPLQPWYNAAYLGKEEGSYEGLSITPGLVTDWYCRYGPSGIIQGGLLFGLICRLGEEAFRRSGGRPLQLIFSIGLIVFVFRSFRSFSFITLYPLLIGVVAILLLIKVGNLVTRPPEQA